MKNFRIGLLLLALGLVLVNCSDESTPTLSDSGIRGTWVIMEAEGTEWEKGVGIVTPRAADSELQDGKVIVTADQVIVQRSSGAQLGSFGYELNVMESTIELFGVGTFDIDFNGHNMDWSQQEPTDSDYEERDPGVFLFFQKFWNLQESK